MKGLTLAALLLLTVACNNSSSTTTPTTATALTTETFTGSVDVSSSDSHPFTVAQAGEVDITLTAAGPPATIFMGLGIGTPSGASCALIAGGTTNAQAGSAAQLAGTANAGTYCVAVYDIGNQTAAITYTLTVAHP